MAAKCNIDIFLKHISILILGYVYTIPICETYPSILLEIERTDYGIGFSGKNSEIFLISNFFYSVELS